MERTKHIRFFGHKCKVNGKQFDGRWSMRFRGMKRILIVAVFIVLLFTLILSQQQSFVEVSTVLNIEVPVRVYDGEQFINDLTISDFEVFENGIPQKVEAVYLIKRDRIERKEEKREFDPEMSRCFYLFLEVSEYRQKLQKAIRHFIYDVFLSNDDLIAITPGKSYRLTDESKKNKSRDEIFEELNGIIRSGALAGSTEFRHTTADLEQLSREMNSYVQMSLGLQEGGEGIREEEMQVKLVEYIGLMSRLQTFRQADEMRLLDLARYLQTQSGQNFVFYFYEKKMIPQIEPRLLEQFLELTERDPYVVQSINSSLEYNKYETFIDVDKITQAFADSSTPIHFLHISEPALRVPGVHFEEYSQETFNVLFEVSKATGGYSGSSSNAEFLFQKALDASENYYLLYYSPKDYMPDDKFRHISVKVKGKNYRVLHRAGYLAD